MTYSAYDVMQVAAVVSCTPTLRLSSGGGISVNDFVTNVSPRASTDYAIYLAVVGVAVAGVEVSNMAVDLAITDAVDTHVKDVAP